MTDFASLAIEIDSRPVGEGVAALDKLTQAGGRAEQATKGFQGEWVRASSEAGRLRLGLIGAEAQMQKVTVSAGQQRAGMQQLSYQIGDVAQQFAMGTNPMIIFAQQGGQVVQALNMMRGGAGGLIGFLAGPWGTVILGATMILGPMIGKLLAVGDAASEATAKVYDLKAALADLKTKPMEALGNLNAQVLTAEGKLRAAQLLPRFNGDTRTPQGRAFAANTYVEQQRNKAMADAQAEVDAAKLNLRVAEFTAKSIDTLAGAAGKASGATKQHGAAVRGSSSAMSEAQKNAAALAKSEEALAIAEMRSAYAFREKMEAMGRDSLAPGLIGALKPDTRTVFERLADDTAEALGKLPDLTAQWNDELDGAIDRLGRIGGLGGDIAGWARALTTGDVRGVSGAAGALLSMPAGTMFDKNRKENVAVTIADRIGTIFDGPSSKFGKTMKGILEGAATGGAVGTILFGQNNQAAQFGSMAGGALGEAAGKKLFSKLGDFAGPLGSIIGGVLGGIVGNIFGKKPRGSGTVSNSSVTASANDGGIKASLDSFGLGVQQSVSSIADKLGGTVGTYSVGIGRYKDAFQVANVSGAAGLGGSYYQRNYPGTAVYDGPDESAALRAAISVAISQGAIEGVRAGTNTLLKSGKDIEAQLAKALKFEGAFNDLKQATDPVGYALDQITKKFDDLRKIFAEAGASAADYADLEKLLALQRADASQQARQDIVSKVNDPITMGARILELLGQTEKSVAATRLLEVAGLKDSLQPMQAMIYTLEDARAVIDKFTPLRDDLNKFRDELLGEGSTTSFGYLTAQFRATALAAANGDSTAMGGLRGSASDYLSAAKDNAGSLAEYNRARAEVLAATDKALFAANEQIDYQQAVIDTAKTSQQMADFMATMNANILTIAGQMTNGAQVLSLLKRWDGGDSGSPLQVEVIA